MSSFSTMASKKKTTDHRSDYKQRLDHRRVHREHLAWVEDLRRWREEYRSALIDLARRVAGHELELTEYEGELDRHEAAIQAHEDLVKSHDEAIAYSKRGGITTPAEYETVHDQMDTRHERSGTAHERLESRHRALLRSLAGFAKRRDAHRRDRSGPGSEAERRLAELVNGALDSPLGARLALAAEVAQQRQVEIWLVGGAVRDLYLTGEIRDLDLLVAGDAAALAPHLAQRLEARLEGHPEFLTAGVVDGEGVRLDLASARKEEYPEPAALPVVSPGSVKEDLARRDFTVNALAVGLDTDRRFRLLDPFGGLRDLEERLLRVLHERSFRDDPTRILRGLRLEHRLGFAFEPGTEALVHQAMAQRYFGRLSGTRLWRELEFLLEEPGTAGRRFERLAEIGVLEELHPRLELTDELGTLLARIDDHLGRQAGEKKVTPGVVRLYLLALARPLARSERRELAARLQLGSADRQLTAEGPERVRRALQALAQGEVKPHEVDAHLQPLAGEEIQLLEALGEAVVKGWVGRWRSELSRLRLTIGGNDLLARGAAPGPHIGRALQETREARLDGAIDAAGELDFALARLTEDGLLGGFGTGSVGGRE
jgi:tRNA nucleotidyltransferase (CCA-adding enzyme)